MSVSITVPNNQEALELAAKFFQEMATLQTGAVTGWGRIESIDPKVAEAMNDVNELVDAQGKGEPPVIAAVPAPPVIAAVPAPPVAAAVPAPPVAAAVPAVAPEELDIKGMPWDSRIHAATKTKTKGGLWKLKRGVAQSLVVQVEAERATKPVPAPAPVPPAPVPPVIAAVPAPPVAAAVPAPPVAAAPSPTNFIELNTAIMEQNIETALVTAACVAVGLESYPQLGARADLVPAVAAKLGL